MPFVKVQINCILLFIDCKIVKKKKNIFDIAATYFPLFVKAKQVT